MSILFSFCDQTINNAAITGNGSHQVLVTNAYANNSGKNSLRVVITFSDPLPLDGNPEPTGYSISCVVEGLLNSDDWYPLAYHFDSWRNFDNGSQKIIVLQPNILSTDDGIDTATWVGGQTLALISRQQGQCADTIRLRIIVRETKHGTPEAFQSVHISAKGELYDAA